jgi:hypothetical protein
MSAERSLLVAGAGNGTASRATPVYVPTFAAALVNEPLVTERRRAMSSPLRSIDAIQRFVLPSRKTGRGPMPPSTP